MEVNKEQAERCRDLGAEALRRGDTARAVKFLGKSLQLYPLPGVEALLQQAERQGRSSSSSTSSSSRARESRDPTPQQQQQQPAEETGADGRSYTQEQVTVVQRVLQAKEGGRGAHYRVLQLPNEASEAQIKKAYRKLALKLHPDKNSAPHTDEAFKAVGLAYATLSDTQKRHIYDRYGEEDPDNRGGGGGGGPRGGGGAYGQEMSPEDIFNMFFGGGMPNMHQNGGGGFHVYSSGFGPGMQFRAARPRQRQQPRDPNNAGGRGAEQDTASGMSMLLQLLPVLLIAALSFLRFNETDVRAAAMPGEGKYFSLTFKDPFTHRLTTRLTDVKDIPFFVTERFMHTYHRNRYQLGQVEVMVERAYEQYLVNECKSQIAFKRKLELAAAKESSSSGGGVDGGGEGNKNRNLEKAKSFDLSRCVELEDLFPRRKRGNTAYGL